MARIRTIKPEFWSDEKLSPMEPIDRLVFLGLISMADDAGRLLGNLKVIDAFIFPTTDHTARESLANLSRIGRVAYGTTSSGQAVIQIVGWSRHQKVDHPNVKASLPEIVEPQELPFIVKSLANDSRMPRDGLASLPTTSDQRPTTDKPAPKQNGNSPSWPAELAEIIQGDGVTTGVGAFSPGEIGRYCKAAVEQYGLDEVRTAARMFARHGRDVAPTFHNPKQFARNIAHWAWYAKPSNPEEPGYAGEHPPPLTAR